MNTTKTRHENTVPGCDIEKLVEKGRMLHSQAVGNALMRLIFPFRRHTEKREQLIGKERVSYI